ncbi:serine/threonine protein kinase, partial [bacterium]|nr:serine/threonine protein kinase [bacterium]
MRLGSYEVQGEIGRGACGVVYRARDARGADVAVKILTRSGSADARSRFARESRLLSSLGEKDGFVPFLGSGEDASGPYIVMPFVGGGTLRQRLTGRPMEIGEAVSLGAALAHALGRAHARGIVHRDMKPENVLFDGNGRPLIADLGLAKHFSKEAAGASRSVSLSFRNQLLGTVGYMPPEQVASAKEATPASDVFALGAILHECLTGRPAFDADTMVELLVAVERCRVTPLSDLRPDAPRWLADTVARALRKEPGERFEDGAAFARALRGPRTRGALSRAAVALAIVAAMAATGWGAYLLVEWTLASRRKGESRELAARARAELLQGRLPSSSDIERAL